MEIVVPKDKEGHEILVYGEDQGFLGLPVRSGTERFDIDNGYYIGVVTVTAWKPSVAELQALNRGEAIYVELNTATVAPMRLTVQPAAEFDVRKMLTEQK